jgi:hypothetical protein
MLSGQAKTTRTYREIRERPQDVKAWQSLCLMLSRCGWDLERLPGHRGQEFTAKDLRELLHKFLRHREERSRSVAVGVLRLFQGLVGGASVRALEALPGTIHFEERRWQCGALHHYLSSPSLTPYRG